MCHATSGDKQPWKSQRIFTSWTINCSLQVLIFLHHIQWKLEFISIVCGPPEQPTFFSYSDVRNQLSWPKAKQTCKSQTSCSGQSGDSYQLHKLWWRDHSRDAVSLHPTQEKISSALDQHPASIHNLMFFYPIVRSQAAWLSLCLTGEPQKHSLSYTAYCKLVCSINKIWLLLYKPY